MVYIPIGGTIKITPSSSVKTEFFGPAEIETASPISQGMIFVKNFSYVFSFCVYFTTDTDMDIL